VVGTGVSYDHQSGMTNSNGYALQTYSHDVHHRHPATSTTATVTATSANVLITKPLPAIRAVVVFLPTIDR
jgi:hypothetical protein